MKYLHELYLTMCVNIFLFVANFIKYNLIRASNLFLKSNLKV